ncbi:Protein FIZZY-RELATED 2 [Gracilariopsis chorda]|uniref:Protein FIZZY-RELATED 2 n=1 Tax=Gracilariopsis chorda TaxID=448386 RepID=A0A2V3ILM2_9FLOR|nr:Protein FIZZY-RELATED 2 [Gracilariopsis chorda]|eukprot:PXF42947.1 Protein FIZZY-RELATED 2 [Gracilariopsis chorda]
MPPSICCVAPTLHHVPLAFGELSRPRQRTARTTLSPSSPPSCYSLLLKSELLDARPPQTPAHLTAPPSLPVAPRRDTRYPPKPASTSTTSHLHPGFEGLKRLPQPSASATAPSQRPISATNSNMFRFKKPRPASADAAHILSNATSHLHLGERRTHSALLSMGAIPQRASRRIPRSPFKVLDAPYLTDDFYLNLVDWGSQNVLAVGLQNCVYLWSACTSKVTTLCDLQFGGPVCSVAWNQQGTHLAIGTRSGGVQVWDAAMRKLVRTMSGHSARVGCLAWNSALLSSGGRDTNIFNRDLRCKEPFVAKLEGHTQEVCGLRWSLDDMQLASGGNDNDLFIWNAVGLGSGGTVSATASRALYNSPMIRFDAHVAAVKAIAWSPHARGLLASGGGTADRTIRFWNTTTNSALGVVDTGSQVCNLAWSKNVNEIVSTHGYSQNQIIVWKYPTLSKVVTLMGHSLRVLYLAMSPTGETIVTGAGDETLRFWNVFPSAKNPRGSMDSSSRLSPLRMSIR